ncbi:FAD binding domain protein [Aspergillus terreus]|uniref:FAD binding domain protein n=1 Tax=Aspergillus terreus TaxID=33178 RepID=A0A5M3ZEI0_ASPTE|nr:hypothetical protein ATETN484_0013028600 [Aspergillus terreus]GFF20520.1 FAD binding domain protein [Aspergillus terreus]
MRLSLAFLLAISGVAVAQTAEPSDFDVTAALEEYGVDVSAIPQLAGLQQRSIGSACTAACGSLKFLYGASRVFAQNTTTYQNFTSSYWSVQQEEVEPHCVFKPAKDTDVSILVLLSRLTQCPFAAKSGGHAAFAGASSSQGGITVWLKDINAITLNSDRSIASVGPGNTWTDVYSALAPYGLAVIGGRVSEIGVGGLTTGGGISYYSNLYGWAADNVKSFEVVTAWGQIVTASETEHSDLYWALRGGGNNFGIVTKFNYYTIPSGNLFGGTRLYTQDKFPEVLNAFINVVNNASVDGKAQQYVAFVNTQGMNLASAELTYVADDTEPAIFAQYRSIPAISDSLSTKTLVEYCASVQKSNPNGLREIYWPITVHLDEDFANWAVDYFLSVVPQVANVSGINPVLIYQGITEPILNNMTKFGGNALGLDASQGPLHLMHMSTWWDNATDDETVYQFVSDYFAAVVAKAKSLGLYHEYIYMNYASQFQDVISSYGSANKARLQAIASKYDPTGVYQTLQPGYFKLDGGAPVATNPL